MTQADLAGDDFTKGFISLLECGRTRVVCAASVEDKVPPFLLGAGKGWVTAEYSMLPSSTPTRSPGALPLPSLPG